MSDNVVLISYPSGGFGHFIFHALTAHASNTYKVTSDFKFDDLGTSHQAVEYTKKFNDSDKNYVLNHPDPSKIALVLCDNGINNDNYDVVKTKFPKSPIIRLCISESIKPIIHQTQSVKARNWSVMADITRQVIDNWEDWAQDYAQRENFTLLYHNWNYRWAPNESTINIDIESLVARPVETITNIIHAIGGQVINPESLADLCNKWKTVNQQYFQIYYTWKDINHSLDNNQTMDLTGVDNLHDQGYINYCLEKKFNIVIPVYDYRHWFKTTDEILEMYEKLRSNNQ